jgi:hypothetical protein
LGASLFAEGTPKGTNLEPNEQRMCITFLRKKP